MLGNLLGLGKEQPKVEDGTGIEVATRAELEEQFADKAEAKVLALITEEKIFPAEAAGVSMAIINAYADDKLFGGQVQMVKNGEVVTGSRAEQMLAIFEGRPKHGLTAEAVKVINAKEAVVLDEEPKSKDNKETATVSSDRKKSLLNMTEAGRKALADKESTN